MALIEEKLGWGEAATWASNDFEELSIRIQDATGKVISATTLKRIWGRVAYSSKPSTHSLDTLAVFLGYPSWREFRIDRSVADKEAYSDTAEPVSTDNHKAGSNSVERISSANQKAGSDAAEPLSPANQKAGNDVAEPVSPANQESGSDAEKTQHSTTERAKPDAAPRPAKKKSVAFGPNRSRAGSFLSGRVLSVFMLFLGAALVLWLGLWMSSEEPAPASAAEAQFESRPVAFDLPNTVVFEYDVSGVRADSFFIQQSWDRRLRKRIDPANSVHASTYFYPGYYQAKLIANDDVLMEHPVHIKTPGWNVMLEENPVPLYLPDEALSQNGALEASEEWLNKAGYPPSSGNHVQAFYLVQDFGALRMDNFSMDVVLSHIKGQPTRPCQGAQLTIRGEEGMIRFPFDIPGCTGLMHVIAGMYT